MTHPMWLWYMRMNYSFCAQSSFGSAEYSKKNTHPLIFSEDWLIQSSEKWKCGDKFSCAHLSRIRARSSKVSMLSRICIVFIKNSHQYSVWENQLNTDTNNNRFQKVIRIRIRILVLVALKYLLSCLFASTFAQRAASSTFVTQIYKEGFCQKACSDRTSLKICSWMPFVSGAFVEQDAMRSPFYPLTI